MKLKMKRMVLSMPIASLPVLFVIACSSQTPDNQNNKEKLIKEVKDQFATSYKTSLKVLSRQWKEKMILENIEDLGISFNPRFEDPIKIFYYFEKVKQDLGIVFIRAEIIYEEQLAETIIFEVNGFKTSKDLILEDIDAFFEKIEPIMKTPDKSIMARHYKNVIDESFFVDVNAEDLNGINFRINHKESHVNDIDGTLIVKLIAEKNNIPKDKTIKIEGFKTIEQICSDIEKYLQNFSEQNPFDFKEEIASNATWNALLNKIVEQVEKMFGKHIVDLFSWKIVDENKSTIWGIKNLNSIAKTSINFSFKDQITENSNIWKEVYFKNIKLNEQEKNIYKYKNILESVFENEIKSDHYENQKALYVKNDLENIGKYDFKKIEKILGINITEKLLKDNVIVGVTNIKILDKKNGKDYETIALTIEISIKNLVVTLSKELWVTFKN